MATSTEAELAHARVATIDECQAELLQLAAEYEAKAKAYRDAAGMLGRLKGPPGACACGHKIIQHTFGGCSLCRCQQMFT